MPDAAVHALADASVCVDCHEVSREVPLKASIDTKVALLGNLVIKNSRIDGMRSKWSLAS